MDRFIRQYKDFEIRIAHHEDKILFNLLDVAYAVGYSKASSLRYHTKHKKREIQLHDGIFLKSITINKISKEAHKTPEFKPFAEWARTIAEKLLKEIHKPVEVIIEESKKNQLFTITESAKTVGMDIKEFSDWLVAEGYAKRYQSNNAIYFSNWFKDNSYGTNPIINDGVKERISRVPKLTVSGLEFVKARLESQRQASLLFFTKKKSYSKAKEEEERLDKEFNDLIIEFFTPYRHSMKYDHLLQPNKKEYRVDQDVLISLVKQIVSKVKLKELQ